MSQSLAAARGAEICDQFFRAAEFAARFSRGDTK
jgi:hypothetical protein